MIVSRTPTKVIKIPFRDACQIIEQALRRAGVVACETYEELAEDIASKLGFRAMREKK